MKWVLSMVFAMLVALFCVDFAPVQKSLVYAQSTPTSASASVDDGEGVDEEINKKVVACDNYGYVWTINIKKGKITGNVDTGTCGVWKVTGTYKKKNITLNAKNQEENGCCTTFTYTGKFNKKTKVGSGSWTNACGGSGSWTMGACQ